MGYARFVLACLTGVYAAACWVALAPGWLTDGHGATAIVAVLATVTSAVLFKVRSLTRSVTHWVLGLAPLVVAGLTWQADGGVDLLRAIRDLWRTRQRR